jgi:hypothetical protein
MLPTESFSMEMNISPSRKHVRHHWTDAIRVSIGMYCNVSPVFAKLSLDVGIVLELPAFQRRISCDLFSPWDREFAAWIMFPGDSRLKCKCNPYNRYDQYWYTICMSKSCGMSFMPVGANELKKGGMMQSKAVILQRNAFTWNRLKCVLMFRMHT